MDPEFKAFIEAMAPECAEARRRRRTPLRRLLTALSDAYELFDDAITAVGAFRCDFRPFQRLREVCERCKPERGIGYHGLV